MMVKEKKPSKNKANRHAVVEDDQNIINQIRTIAFTFWVVFFIIQISIKQVLTYAFTFWAVFFIIQIPYFEVINQVRTYVFTFWAVFFIIQIHIIEMNGRNPINRVLTYIFTFLAVFLLFKFHMLRFNSYIYCNTTCFLDYVFQIQLLCIVFVAEY